MQLTEEEKAKQGAISDAISRNQPVEDLAEDDLREEEKIENSILMGLRKDPIFIKKEDKNEENEQNEELPMGTMGICTPPKKESAITRFFRKLFGK